VVSGQQHAPAALYPRERTGTHFTGGWVGLRTGLDGRKISSPPGFDPRTVQSVVSRYTDWATRSTCCHSRIPIIIYYCCVFSVITLFVLLWERNEYFSCTSVCESQDIGGPAHGGYIRKLLVVATLSTACHWCFVSTTVCDIFRHTNDGAGFHCRQLWYWIVSR